MVTEKNKLFGTLLVAIIISFLFGQFFPKDKNKYASDRFYQLKAMAKPVYDIIIMGDSRAREGVSPNVIEDSIPGIRVLNFAFSNGGLNPVMFNAAEKKMKPESKNKCIILAVTALTLHPSTLTNKQYIEEISRPREDKIERVYLAGLFSYFSPVTPEQLKNYYSREPQTVQRFQTFSDNGWSPSDRIPPDTAEAIPYYVSDFKSAPVSMEQLDKLSEQVKNWNDQGIKVFCFRPPTTQGMKNLENEMGKYNEPLIRQKLVQAGATWIDTDTQTYESFDGSHLTKKSAIRLSSEIAHAIKTRLSKPF